MTYDMVMNVRVRSCVGRPVGRSMEWTSLGQPQVEINADPPEHANASIFLVLVHSNRIIYLPDCPSRA